MSREIKFRAYDKGTKRFVQEDKDLGNRQGYNLGMYALNSSGELNFYEVTEGGMAIVECKNVEITLFTGLKDKNGKEIYFDDIHRNNETEVVARVVWDEGLGAGYRDAEGVWQGRLEVWAARGEVIGNIYENPNLLTV